MKGTFRTFITNFPIIEVREDARVAGGHTFRVRSSAACVLTPHTGCCVTELSATKPLSEPQMKTWLKHEPIMSCVLESRTLPVRALCVFTCMQTCTIML